MARYLFHYAQLRVNLRRNKFPGHIKPRRGHLEIFKNMGKCL
jgi:hypothetical protein